MWCNMFGEVKLGEAGLGNTATYVKYLMSNTLEKGILKPKAFQGFF